MSCRGPCARLVLLALVALPLGLGCGPEAPRSRLRDEPPGPTVLVADLLADAEAAETGSTTGGFRFGTEEARPHLALGWSRDAEDSAGPNVWGLGAEAWLELPLVLDDGVLAEVRAAALAFPDAPAQDVEVLLNGRPVDRFRPNAHVEDHRIRLPKKDLWLGRNRLGFRFAWSRRPVDVLAENRDRRDLAVRFYRLGLRGVETVEELPRFGPEEDLTLPRGTAVTWYLPASPVGSPTGLWLRVGERRGNLEVEIRGSERQDPLVAVDLPAGPAGWLGPVDAEGAGILRIAVGAPDGPSDVDELELRTRGPSGLAAPATPEERERTATERARPDVLLYVVDTLRADHLSAYGYERPTSPRLEELAADGILFAEARAQSSWTRSAMVSVLTGRTPPGHGVISRSDALGPEVPVLADLLGGAGWTTAAWVTNGNLAQNFSLDRGFDHFRYLNESRDRPTFHQSARAIHDEVIPWLEAREEPADPWFLWLHATDPHAPYVPSEPWLSRFAPGVDPDLGRIDRVHGVSQGIESAPEGTAEAWLALYDAEIAATDAEIGRLLDHLRETGTYDEALIVFTSDHGEEFAEHGGWEHGKTLFDEQLHVPLIVKLPGNAGAGTVRRDLVRQIDVLPTILELLGLPSPEGIEGESLLSERRSAATDRADEPSYAHLEIDERQIEGVIADGLKLVADRSPLESARGQELFDLEADPGETRNLWAERPIVAGWLEQEMRRIRRAARLHGSGAGREAEIDPELRERLEALGYLK